MKMFTYLSLLIYLVAFGTDSVLASHIYDVIIIGAGPSGIAATSTLLKNNVDDILVLEAEGRIGGRINSVKFGDAYVDLGAEWITGNENVAFDLVKGYDVIEYKNYSNGRYFYSNRAELPKDVVEKYKNIEKETYSCREIEDGINVGEYCEKEFQRFAANLTIPSGFPHLLEDLLEHLRHVVLGWAGALDWHEPSAALDSVDCDIHDTYAWKGSGYKTVLDILLQKFPENSKVLATDDKILLGKEVAKIQWDNSDDMVKVKCEDGAEYVTKRVIFTPSVGVLKAKMDSIFEPALPDDKRRAIESLGIGAVAKVMLQFSDDWWNKDGKFDALQLIWEKEMRESLKTNFTVNGHVWITDISVVVPAEENPKVIAVWFEGSSVPTIEELNEQKLVEGIQFALHQFLGHKFDVSPPIRVLRSKWYTNPHFRGTYSYQTVESRKKPSNVDLGNPIKNTNGNEVLQFAGEATSPNQYGTVHGALQTGLREAHRIIAL